MDLVDFFSGLDTSDNFHDARVDPFEPRRVWITSTPTTKVVGPVECFGVKVTKRIKQQSFLTHARHESERTQVVRTAEDERKHGVGD